MPTVFAAVKGLVFSDGKFLLLKQDVGGEIFWDLPGGRIEFGESPSAALEREMREELGIKVTIGRPLGLWWFFRKTDGDQVVCSTFQCEIQSGAMEIAANGASGETIAGAVWVTKENLAGPEFASMYPSLRAVLEAA